MGTVKCRDNRLVAGRFSLELVRTLRVPVDADDYPLPPGFSSFPLYSVKALARSSPAAARIPADFVVPFYQYEAMWLRFEAAEWKPNAVQIWSGGVNVLTGEAFPSPLRRSPQNYLVCPTQPWLDGFRTGTDHVRQFVAAPLGQGATVQEQLGDDGKPSLLVRVYEPRPGIFPDKRPRGFESRTMFQELPMGDMGFAGGGRIEQQVYADPHPPRTWNAHDFVDMTIQIVNSLTFRSIVGHDPPPSPISTDDYVRSGLPWFRYYDDDSRAVRGVSKPMKSISPIDVGDRPVHPSRIRTLRKSSTKKGR
jgi:hypothetical protein